MLFGDVIAIALSIFGFLLSLQGLWLVSQALWPARVESAAGWCASRGLSCFLLGLPVSFFTLLVAGIVAKTFGTFGQLSGFSLALLYVVYANVGTAGFVTHIGRRLASPADVERPWKATIRGGAALELAWLIPILGWLGLMPISLVIGAGATTLALFGAPRRARASAGTYAEALAPSAGSAAGPLMMPAAAPAQWATAPPSPLPAPLPQPMPPSVPAAPPAMPASAGSGAVTGMPPMPQPRVRPTLAGAATLEPAESVGVEG